MMVMLGRREAVCWPAAAVAARMRALAFLKRICFSLDCVALSSQTYRACMRAPQRAKLAEHHFYIPLTDPLEPPPQQGAVELL